MQICTRPGFHALSLLGSVDHIFEAFRHHVFLDPLGKSQLLNQQPSGQFKNFFLTVREFLLFLDQVKLAQNLGNINRVARLDLVIVLALSAAPGSNRPGIGLQADRPQA